MWRRGDVETWRREDTDTIRYGYDTIRCETIQCNTMVRGTIRIRYEYDTITAWYDTIAIAIAITIAIRHDTIQCLVRRYDTMRIRYGYGTDTVRHDTIHWLVIMTCRRPPLGGCYTRARC